MQTQTATADDLATILATALAEQTALLQRIALKLEQTQLGLHDGGAMTIIYANRQHGSLWYRLGSDRNPVGIEETALTGYCTKIEFPRVERRGKEVPKLQITMQGDRPYVVECGYNRNFAKGFLSAIALMSPFQLRQPITICPSPGDDDKVLFCRVYQNGQAVYASYGEDTDWRLTAKAAIDAVTQAWGTSGSTE
ncbi:MAG: hypothetical protein AAFY26_06035 [Cyanobacteria bacterium J06638_22]